MSTEIDRVLDKYHRNPGQLVPILLDVQEITNWLPKDAILEVSAGLGMPPSRVFGVASFFKAFSLVPRGRHTVTICMGTACHVQGAPRLLDATERDLGIKRGAITPDGLFGVDTVNCLGCCGLAPVISVGRDVHGKLMQTDIPKVIEKYRPKEAKSEAKNA
jgi:NADH-quinone oxidoreductase subunit E